MEIDRPRHRYQNWYRSLRRSSSSGVPASAGSVRPLIASGGGLGTRTSSGRKSRLGRKPATCRQRGTTASGGRASTGWARPAPPSGFTTPISPGRSSSSMRPAEGREGEVAGAYEASGRAEAPSVARVVPEWSGHR